MSTTIVKMNHQPSIIFSAFVLLATVAVVNSATFFTRPKEHPDHPGKCYWPPAPATMLSPGERKTIDDCVQLFCLPNFIVAGTSCPPTPSFNSDQMDCVELPGDESLEYPKCCPQVKCVRKVDGNQLY